MARDNSMTSDPDQPFTLSIDKISITRSDSNPTNVALACERLIDAHQAGQLPGSRLKSGRRHEIQVTIPINGDGLQSIGALLFQAGPRFPGIAPYRLEFNP